MQTIIERIENPGGLSSNTAAISDGEAESCQFSLSKIVVTQEGLPDGTGFNNAYLLAADLDLTGISYNYGELTGPPGQVWPPHLFFPSEIPQQIVERLRHLARLPENWYMPGSKRITHQAIQRAAQILRRIQLLRVSRLDAPFIAPSPDGGLALRWETPEKTELHLEIPPNGRPVEYLLVRSITETDVAELEGQLDETGNTLMTLIELV